MLAGVDHKDLKALAQQADKLWALHDGRLETMTVMKPDYREGTWWWHSVLVAEAAAVLRGRHDGRLRGTFARGLGCGGRGVFGAGSCC
jgi:hypothetical protein